MFIQTFSGIAHLDSAFRQHAGIDYLQSTYPVFCQLLFNFISLDLAPELKYILFRPPDTDDETLSIGIQSLFYQYIYNAYIVQL